MLIRLDDHATNDVATARLRQSGTGLVHARIPDREQRDLRGIRCVTAQSAKRAGLHHLTRQPLEPSKYRPQRATLSCPETAFRRLTMTKIRFNERECQSRERTPTNSPVVSPLQQTNGNIQHIFVRIPGPLGLPLFNRHLRKHSDVVREAQFISAWILASREHLSKISERPAVTHDPNVPANISPSRRPVAAQFDCHCGRRTPRHLAAICCL